MTRYAYDGRSARSTFEAVGSAVVVVVFLGYFVWYGIVPKLRSAGADGAVIALDVSVEDPHELGVGSTINRRLTGSLVVPILLQDAAMCRNGTDWLSDFTVNNFVVVSTSPNLIRAAELATSERFDGDFVRDVEQRLWDGADPSRARDGLVADGWDAQIVDEYLVERARGPSHEAQEQFVAYAAATDNFGRGVLRVIDVHDLDKAAIGAFSNRAASPRIFVAGEDTNPRRPDSADCRDTLDELGPG